MTLRDAIIEALAYMGPSPEVDVFAMVDAPIHLVRAELHAMAIAGSFRPVVVQVRGRWELV
jgi:hypothetical protein